MSVLHPKTNVGVLRGGASYEYDLSLDTGGYALEQLSHIAEPQDIFIDRRGRWHERGFERKPSRILERYDVIFNALHGNFGENGRVQRILDHHQSRYTGSKGLSAHFSYNKERAKDTFQKNEIKTPEAVVVRARDEIHARAREIFRTFHFPAVVKPVHSGNSYGVVKVESFHGFLAALSHAFEYDNAVLVERFIPGRHMTCTVVENFRNELFYTPIPVEVECDGIFNYRHHRHHTYKKASPREQNITARVQQLARKAHTALDLRHYSRSDFVISPKGEIYILETNALPHLSDSSPFMHSLQIVGVKAKEFFSHVLELALKK